MKKELSSDAHEKTLFNTNNEITFSKSVTLGFSPEFLERIASMERRIEELERRYQDTSTNR